MNERRESAEAAQIIDLAIEEQDRREATERFFVKIQEIMRRYEVSPFSEDGDKTFTPYASLKSNTADIWLRIFARDKDYHLYQAGIEGTVAQPDQPTLNYLFILNGDGTGSSKKIFHSLAEINSALKKLDLIEKELRALRYSRPNNPLNPFPRQ